MGLWEPISLFGVCDGVLPKFAVCSSVVSSLPELPAKVASEAREQGSGPHRIWCHVLVMFVFAFWSSLARVVFFWLGVFVFCIYIPAR